VIIDIDNVRKQFMENSKKISELWDKIKEYEKELVGVEEDE
jgi:hypothetical protein